MSDMSPEPITLTMNDGTYAAAEPDTLTIAEWAALNGVSERAVKRWLAPDSDWEIPGAHQEPDGKRRWQIPRHAMRVRKPKLEEEPVADEETTTTETSTDLALVEPEVEKILWGHDIEAYLARMPAHIPVRIGAMLMGLGIGYVKANAEKYEILHRGGPNQTDVMPKRVVLEMMTARTRG